MPTERAIPGTPEWIALAPPHLARYLFAAQFAKGKRVLDAGTGAGYGAALLATPGQSGDGGRGGGGASQVTAVDIDQSSIAAAEKLFPMPNLSFLADDCQTLANVKGPFDLICNFENIEHLPSPEKFLAAASRLLAPGGILLTSTPDRASTPPFKNGKPANPYHFHEWYRDEFLALLSPHFQSIDMRVQVESYAVSSRLEAVKALRQALVFSNPILITLWRKIARIPQSNIRAWKSLESLAAATPVDYPIVLPTLTPLYGASAFHFAVCSNPRPAIS